MLPRWQHVSAESRRLCNALIGLGFAAVTVLGPAGTAPARAATPAPAVLPAAVPAPAALPGVPALGAPVAPFPGCPDQDYQVQTQLGQLTTLGYFDLGTSTFVPIRALGKVVNAVGYSTTQNVFWGMDTATVGHDKMVRIDSAGNLDYDLPPNGGGPVPAPAELTVVTGTVDGDRLILHSKTPANHLIIIDVDPASATFGGVLADRVLSRVTPGWAYLNIGDWDVNPVDGKLYSLESAGAGRRTLVRIDPATGTVTDVYDLTAAIPDGTNFGAVYVEKGDNVLYVSNNDVNRQGHQSQTFRVDIGTGAVRAFIPGAPLAINDGAGCLRATDHGDAPGPYRTLVADSGPRHLITEDLGDPARRLVIGARVDADMDGLPGVAATGDDLDGTADEDGVPAGYALQLGDPRLTVPVVNTTGQEATLAGWVDLDRNGTFDPGERATAPVPAGATAAVLVWPVGPSGTAPFAPTDTVYLRLRLYPGVVADPAPAGAAVIGGGEVEDHRVPLGLGGPTALGGPTPLPVEAGGTLPVTGVGVAPIIGVAIFLFGAGLLSLALGRRRR